MPIHRTLKNVVKNYTFAEVKVREATSNDPWGPSTTLMSEIADLTFNMVAFAEVMQMIWKRLNDSGKNWRHVYKSLVLLDYLVKTGSEGVAQQCKESILTIQTLKDFQFVEEGKDHGQNVRDKAKQLVALLSDEERFKNERTKALTAKERYAINTGAPVRRDTAKVPHSTSDRYLYSSAGGSPVLNSELESVRPSSYGEEDLQLQLALAMSKEEHDEDMKRRKGDELKLQMAIEESKKLSDQNPAAAAGATGGLVDFNSAATSQTNSRISTSATWDGQLSNQASAGATFDPWAPPPPVQTKPPEAVDPWGAPSFDNHPPAVQRSAAGPVAAAPAAVAAQPAASDPWSPLPASNVASSGFGQLPAGGAAGPWGGGSGYPSQGGPASNGLHGGSGGGQIPQDEFDLLSAERSRSPQQTGSMAMHNISMSFDPLVEKKPDVWDMKGLDRGLLGGTTNGEKKKTAEEFLGPNANLVNLNDLVTKPPPSSTINPFAMTTMTNRTQSPAAQLFAARAQAEEQSRRVPINQLATSHVPPPVQQPAPLVPGSWAVQGGYQAPPMMGMPPAMYAAQPMMYQQQPALQPYPQQHNPFI